MAKIKTSRIAKFVRPYRVTEGKKFRLQDWDPADTAGLKEEKKRAREILAAGAQMLADLQDRLYAQDRWSILLVFQAMDAAGKDGTIKHVMSGVNPQGCQVFSFKAPSAEDLDHDFLWRTTKCVPERGRIGIFNRSYYEEVLVVRVHPEFLAHQKLPPKLVGKRIWEERYESIADFEKHMARNGTVILKFFLNVSRREQKKRFMERLDMPTRTGSSPRPTRRSGSTGRTTWRPTRTRFARRRSRGLRGTSSPPTTNGSRASSSPARSSRPWTASTSTIPPWTTPRRRNSRAARKLLLSE